MTDLRRPGPARPPVRLRPAPAFEPPSVDEDAAGWPRPAPGSRPVNPGMPWSGDGRRPAGPGAAWSGREPARQLPPEATDHGHARGHPGCPPLRRHLPGGVQRVPAAGAATSSTRSGSGRGAAARARPGHRSRGSDPGGGRARGCGCAGCASASLAPPQSRPPPCSPVPAVVAGRWRSAWSNAAATGSAPTCGCSDRRAHDPTSTDGSPDEIAPGSRADGRVRAGRWPPDPGSGAIFRSRAGSLAGRGAAGRTVAALVLATRATGARRVAGRSVAGGRLPRCGLAGVADRDRRTTQPPAAWSGRPMPSAGARCSSRCTAMPPEPASPSMVGAEY